MVTKVAIAGANGRMGQMLIEAANQDNEISLFSAFQRDGDVDNALKGAHVLIDFTRPESTLSFLNLCIRYRVNVVIGTTGFSDVQKKQIAEFATKIAIVLAANTSLGVNVTQKLVSMAAAVLGDDADIDIFEAHHKMKVDAPSGTALMLGEAAATARGQLLADVAVFDRHAKHEVRQVGSIGFASVRMGDVIGDHTVFFALNGERIEITHRSQSRTTYANGAIRAAKFLQDKTSGLYNMNDVLGLN